MARTSLWFAVVALGLAAPAVQAAVQYSDGDFTFWTFDSLADPGCSTLTERLPAGGNPGAQLSCTTVTPLTGGWAWAICLDPAANWTPAVNGPIAGVSMDIDVQSVSGWGQGQALDIVVLQDGKYYGGPAIPHALTGPDTEWHTVLVGPLTADHFVYMQTANGWDPIDHPDFSSSGAPMTFGFTVGNWASETYTQHYDNWRLTVPEPATLSLLALGGLAMMARRRRNR
jgi:hypothetical protein